jgi:hypothetical protein
MSYYNPYWAKAVQNQQKAQAKPEARQQPSKVREDKPGDNGGFDSLIVGRECIVKLGTGETVRGIVSAASRYFYLISIDGQVVIVNKAYVVSITPIQEGGGGNKQNNQGGGVNGNQGSR